MIFSGRNRLATWRAYLRIARIETSTFRSEIGLFRRVSFAIMLPFYAAARGAQVFFSDGNGSATCGLTAATATAAGRLRRAASHTPAPRTRGSGNQGVSAIATSA